MINSIGVKKIYPGNKIIKNIAIATHVFSPGTAQALKNYCLRKKMNVLFIKHSLSGSVVTWTLGATNTLLQVIKTRKKFDVFVGYDRLNASVGILLKRIGRAKKVIYFSPDWSENRFSNPLLNNIFQWFDYFCVKYADLIWNSSAIMPIDLMMKEREKKGYPKKWRSKQIQVPDGTDPVEKVPFNKIKRYQIGFVGHLKKGMGLELLVSAFPEIIKHIPQAKVLIIGSGPIEEELREKAKGLNIEFTGFMGDISQVYRQLAKCAIAIAPYEKNTISQYTDPGKVKNYLSVNLPVIITKVPQVAFEIEREKCGIAINCDKDELIKAIVKLLKDEELLKLYRKNARKLAKKYSWDNVFDRAFGYLKQRL